MKTTPLKGMKDILPREQRIRDYVQGEILKTYRAAGFERISTPIMEDMENLDKSDGGDNLNLIFKVLKRGDKLEKALASGSEKELSDMGLRYDLTLPLSRYYAANREQLPAPFKVIQTDRVYRAERPQKGRLREFVQCDIDILGDESPNAEVELIDVTARALLAIGFSDFTVHINDRRLLRGMLESFGFAPQALDTVCVTFDKLDKVGPQGVAAELEEKAMPAAAVQALEAFLEKGAFSLDDVSALCADKSLGGSVRYVLDTVGRLSGGRYAVEYTPSLVRGQGYYTGMVFEVTCAAFSGAVAGGGRYDDLTGIFGMPNMSGVGISFGADRIYDVMTGLGLFPADLGCAARVMFANLGEAEEHASLKLLQEVRAAGIPAEIYPENGKMKKQMEYANRRGIPCVVIVGSRELEERVATIKDMTSGEQTQVPFTRLAEALR